MEIESKTSSKRKVMRIVVAPGAGFTEIVLSEIATQKEKAAAWLPLHHEIELQIAGALLEIGCNVVARVANLAHCVLSAGADLLDAAGNAVAIRLISLAGGIGEIICALG
jgi:hypothetical protein